MSKSRNSNIELLRIIMAIGVIFLHLNYSGDSGLMRIENLDNSKIIFSSVIEIFSMVAVNVFLIISGYFLAECEKTKVIKMIKLLVQVSFFSLIAYIAAIIIGISNFSLKEFLIQMIPHNYYITFYVCLLCFAPFISKLCSVLDVKQLKALASLICIVLVVWPFLVSCVEVIIGGSINGMSTISLDGDGAGYTIVNFFSLYILGVALRKEIIRIKHPLITILLAAIILYFWRYGINSPFSQLAFSYNNPVNILMALSYFELFRKLRINNIVINLIGKTSLIVYLVHGYIIHMVGFDWASSASIFTYIGFQLIIVAICFVTAFIGCYIFEFFWKIIMMIPGVKGVNALEITSI